MTIVESLEGVNETPAVVEVTRYISFLHTTKFPEVVPPIETVHVQAD
jgi:hypothetical protein